MNHDRKVPNDPLAFIQRCVRERRIFWTYHVNMRLAQRYIARQAILDAVDGYELVEAYPQDKYLPSCLVLAKHAGSAFHVLFAIDIEGNNIRIVTAYRPSLEEWQPDLRTRRTPK